MIIKSVELTAVAVESKQYPDEHLKEIAIVGRSNVGKSSLINMLLNRKRFARTSSSPGKTQTINFYEINDAFRIVDLPGYGYAKVSKSEREKWGQMIEAYLMSRENLKRVIQLVDLRHPPTQLDIQMYEWLRYYQMDGVVVATKADKISKNQVQKNISIIRKTLQLNKEDIIIPASAVKATGRERILEILQQD